MTTCSRNQLFILSVARSGQLWTQLLTVSIKFSDSQKIVYVTHDESSFILFCANGSIHSVLPNISSPKICASVHVACLHF